MMRRPSIIALLAAPVFLVACHDPAVIYKYHADPPRRVFQPPLTDQPTLVVLGIAQDGGSPQAGCNKACCHDLWQHPEYGSKVASLAIVDPISHERWIIDATPDFRQQLRDLDELMPSVDGTNADLTGIFLTHAHIGHYTGLMFLGHESMGAKNVPVYAMPRMIEFLTNNGPWSQLVEYENIALRPMEADAKIQLNERLSITPFRVPHREEFSEVVGFRIDGPNRSVLYIPDIDKWERWNRSIESYIEKVDRAYLDGTFFDERELPGRDMSRIPHPFMSESINRFNESLDAANRAKIRFIHLNHTNPALQPESAARSFLHGMQIARELERFEL
jgi:pyrroloquinoline quinone biosynthesis protein B